MDVGRLTECDTWFVCLFPSLLTRHRETAAERWAADVRATPRSAMPVIQVEQRQSDNWAVAEQRADDGDDQNVSLPRRCDSATYIAQPNAFTARLFPLQKTPYAGASMQGPLTAWSKFPPPHCKNAPPYFFHGAFARSFIWSRRPWPYGPCPGDVGRH